MVKILNNDNKIPQFGDGTEVYKTLKDFLSILKNMFNYKLFLLIIIILYSIYEIINLL